ncbi:hypothetical protein DACRYDRAFT_87671 [Dacryopinax primogenitus]|uniref:DDE Tnp4 domain-containing protein n=1 Tax=Dacryopinax primogenitus (strain DJM 731) TaxID=1858805 RepID=M5G703_DACPD|nr:uncharacterized protein DACRYDRAFT_87671 [Dacryopinax primogenitus]EJU04494.1 hypothetical protein DACRYDRAFT_87671 [Dacryopinax primogenitus]
MSDKLLAQIFALVPSCITQYQEFALGMMLCILCTIPEGQIAWPKGEEFEKLSDLVTARHPLLKGAFGSMDGLNLPTATSRELIHAVINAPGSWHDARVSSAIYEQLKTNTPEGFFLAADTAFPHNRSSLRTKIMTPLKSGSCTTMANLKFIEQLVSYCQSAEWGMHSIQGSFESNNAQAWHSLLETIFCLHQIRVCRGIICIQVVHPVQCIG